MAEVPQTELIAVQVAYAKPDLEVIKSLHVAPGTTLREAVEQSGIVAEVPEIDISTCAVGIYGKQKTLDTVLREHDRVEIYRPLIVDPKEARMRRAQKKKAAAA